MGAQSVLMEPTLVEGNPLVSFAASTPDEPAAKPQAEPQQQKAGRDWGSFHEIMPYRQSDLKLMAPEMETKNFNRDARAQAAQLRNRWNAEFEGDRQFFAGYGIYDLETADEVTKAPAELRMKAAQIIEQKLERGEVPDWVMTINSLREGGTSESGGGSTGSSAGSTVKTAPVDVKKLTDENDLLLGRIQSGVSENPDLDARKIEENNKLIYGDVDPYERVNNFGNMISQVEGYKDSTDLSSGVFMDPLTKQPITTTDQARESIKYLSDQRQKAVMGLRQAGPEAWGKIPSPDKFKYQTTLEQAAKRLEAMSTTQITPEEHLKTLQRQEWNAYKSALPQGSLVVDYTKGGVPMLEEVGAADPRAGITTKYDEGAAAEQSGSNARRAAQIPEEIARLETQRDNVPDKGWNPFSEGSSWQRSGGGPEGGFPVVGKRTEQQKQKIAQDIQLRIDALEKELKSLNVN